MLSSSNIIPKSHTKSLVGYPQAQICGTIWAIMDIQDEDVFAQMIESPVFFIEMQWGLVPQPLRADKRTMMKIGLGLRDKEWKVFAGSITEEWFEPFIKGEHISWQQWIILLCVEKALRKEAPHKISVVSGHGVGKTATEAWLLIWYLFCHPQAQVPCTAPTASQLFDVLWKEVKVWLDRMPPEVSAQYEWTADHVRMKESPETWFARAKTASKENTEALAGVHGEWVLMLVDEGSGVEEAVYNTAAGALTNENVLVVIISNGTRTIGYFYDSHHKDADNFQNLHFCSQDSPIVSPDYCPDIEKKHGKDSDEYRIRTGYKTGFPKESAMDDGGYVQLLHEGDIHEYVQSEEEDKLFVGHRTMGLDPAGEGKDKTSWAVRDRVKAKIVHRESTSNPKGIGSKTVTLAERYDIEVENFRDITADSFGVGADVGMEVALITKGKGRIMPVNTGEPCDLEEDQELYVNKRAEYYWKLRMWLRSGGSLVLSGALKSDLLSIRYKRTMSGKIQIESKKELKKRGVKSPDDADALSLTFGRELQTNFLPALESNRIRKLAEDYDPNSVFGE